MNIVKLTPPPNHILFTPFPFPLVSTRQRENDSQAQSFLELLTAEAVNELSASTCLCTCPWS